MIQIFLEKNLQDDVEFAKIVLCKIKEKNMLKFLCAEGGTNSNIVIFVILFVVLIGMMVLPYITNRRRTKEFNEMLSQIKVGDLVKTAGGVIGKITKIINKGDFKTVILETGSKTEKSYLEFDLGVIVCVLKSTKVQGENAQDENKTAESVETESESEDEIETGDETLNNETSEENTKTENLTETEKTEDKKTEDKKTEKKKRSAVKKNSSKQK